MSKITIGKYTLESLTTGMYIDPLILFREYIQNSSDAIDDAINKGIITKEESRIDVNLDKTNRQIEIKDNGIGISKSDLPRVFDKGFTGQNGRKKYNSTGLGLYLVKELCNKLGHKVEIKSNDKTEVIITFPIGSYTKEIERN